MNWDIPSVEVKGFLFSKLYHHFPRIEAICHLHKHNFMLMCVEYTARKNETKRLGVQDKFAWLL